MITAEYVQTMARYNAWQNGSLYTAAVGLDDTAREQDRGAFWGSIRKTFAHLYWADMLWTARFDGGEAPGIGGLEALDAYSWEMLWSNRSKLDARIAQWAATADLSDFEGDLTWYSGFFKRDMTRSKALCIVQLFNHQTHHRGQIHGMLTAAGAKPDDTDLQLLPEEAREWH